ATRIRQSGQSDLQILRKWFHAFLQAGRQSTVAFQTPLQTGWQVSPAFNQAWWQIRITVMVVAANHFTITGAEHNPDAATTAVRTSVVILALVLGVFVVALSLAVTLGRKRIAEQDE